MGQIGDGKIHTHYCKLAVEIKSKRSEGVISIVFGVFSDPAKFVGWRF